MKFSLKGTLLNFEGKKTESRVNDVINNKKLLIEPYGNLVDAVFYCSRDHEMK